MSRKLKVLTVLLLAIFVSSVFVGCSSQQPSQTQQKIKVAFIYVGPHNDGGWSQAQDTGRLYLQSQMPNVETTYSENVPEGAQCETVLRNYCNQGYKIIFTTSFGYMDPTYNVAKDYPNVIFMHCSGYKTSANMGTYFGRMYQPDYLSGIVAGKMTKTNYIGFVAPFSTPEVVREIDAFTIGAREVNSKVEVHVVWTNSWFDPVAETSAADTFLANGADIIASGVDDPAPLKEAEKAGKYGIGYDSDMSSSAPTAVLTSRVWDWGPYFVSVVKAVENGTWTNEQYWGQMSTGIVDLAPFGPMVPQDVRQLVDQRKTEIVQGVYDPFNGPIYDQSGKLMVKQGEQLSDADKLNIQWFVQGVVGTIPKSGS
jgi:basic membrane protein A